MPTVITPGMAQTNIRTLPQPKDNNSLENLHSVINLEPINAMGYH